MGYGYAGVAHGRQGEMLAARRRHYAELVLAGMGYTAAARAVVSLGPAFGRASMRAVASGGPRSPSRP